MFFSPVSGWVRTTGWLAGGNLSRCSASFSRVNPRPKTWLRSCTATRPSTRFFHSSLRLSYARAVFEASAVEPVVRPWCRRLPSVTMSDDRDGAREPEVPAALASELARRVDHESDDGLRIVTRSDGVVAVQGAPTAVERFSGRVERILGSAGLARATQYASLAGAGIDAVPGVGNDDPKAFTFSRTAMDLLRRNGIIAADDGVFRAGPAGRSGLPGWMPIPTGTDVVQLQTAAVGLALQATIKGLSDAVDRVENRVDELRDLVRSGQVGEVLGHHRVIAERLRMIESPDSQGLGDTDWSAIAHLHPYIVSGLERTRFFVRSRMGLTEPGRMVRSRVDAAEKLIDANLADALGLLATCEYNLAGWQRLRLDRVARTEPTHLDSVLVDIESSLGLHRGEDQALIDDLVEMIDALMEPTGLEGLELVQRRRLIRHVEEIHAATATFARQRDLDLPDVRNGDLPTLRDSTGLIVDKTREGGRWAFDKVKRGGSTARRALPKGRRPHRSRSSPEDGPPAPDPATRSPFD